MGGRGLGARGHQRDWAAALGGDGGGPVVERLHVGGAHEQLHAFVEGRGPGGIRHRGPGRRRGGRGARDGDGGAPAVGDREWIGDGRVAAGRAVERARVDVGQLGGEAREHPVDLDGADTLALNLGGDDKATHGVVAFALHEHGGAPEHDGEAAVGVDHSVSQRVGTP